MDTGPIPSRDEVALSCTTDCAVTVEGVDGAGGADQPLVSFVDCGWFWISN